MKTIKADLHMHGPIGFQPYWLRKQRYAGKNLLQLIADKAFERDITITAITSQAPEIPKGSVHDRFGCLRDYEAPLLPPEYSTERLGDNILIVEKGENIVYIVNGQTVMPREEDKDFDLLVIGSNQVPNFKPFDETLDYCSNNGLFKGAEHPFVETHRGMGRERLEKYLEKLDSIEGHNSQTIFPKWMARLPVLGPTFSRAGRELNEKAKEIARKYSKPCIATSDAHRIEDLGISYIKWTGEMDNSSDSKFFSQLIQRIKSGQFTTVERYESPLGWLQWVYTFQRGISDKTRDDNEPFVPSSQLR